MSNFINAAYRDLVCVAAATLITLVLGAAFVQSTSVPPGARTPSVQVQT